MLKKICSVLLCLIMVCGLIPAIPTSAQTTVEIISQDAAIFSGGVYDIFVKANTNVKNIAYQWQYDASIGDGSWYDLEDNNAWRGTKTDHLQLCTTEHDGQIIGSGWEKIPFRCRVKINDRYYYSPNFYINIYPASYLYTALKEGKHGISTISAQGVTQSKDQKTGTCAAGDTLNFSLDTTDPSTPQYSTLACSNVSFIPEIYITEKGKTTQFQSKAQYIPQTVGKGTVTVEYRLGLKIGYNDLGTYQSHTMVLDVTEPNLIGTGIAKTAGSVLKEMYTQSQKLCSYTKGSELGLLESIGNTWWKVSYDGCIGYVPVSALTFPQMIAYVAVNIDDPVEGSTPDLIANLGANTYDLYDSDPISWYDRTAKRSMAPTDKFIDGHEYSVSIWVKAKSGYQFDCDSDTIYVQGTIDGHEATIRKAYEQIPKEVLELYYNYGKLEKKHVHAMEYHAAVYPTCTSAGQKGYYSCSCGFASEDSKGSKPIDDFGSWSYLAPTEHTPSVYIGDNNGHFRVCTGCGIEIPGTRSAHTGGHATCQVRAECTVCSFLYGSTLPHSWTNYYDYIDSNGHAHTCIYQGCNEHDTITPHRPGSAATETEPQYCLDCNYIITPAKGHTHKLTKIAKKDATCMDPGNSVYYTCNGCSEWFSDAAGKKVILNHDSVITAPLGHQISDNWKNDETFHWRTCTRCKIAMDETKMLHDDSNKDKKCDTCGYKTKEDAFIMYPDPNNPNIKLPEDENSKPNDTSEDPLSSEPTSSSENPFIEDPDSILNPEKNDNIMQPILKWVLPVVIFLLVFAAALTATIFMIKRKNR